MADGSSLGFDPLFTLDVVRDFMMSNGGKVSNHTLVTHFKSFLNDSQRKNANRQMFKQYVNTLAVVKLDVSGEKMLMLKKKYRDSGSFRREPAAAEFLPSDHDRLNAKRAKKEDLQTTQATSVSGQEASDVEALNDDKENFRSSSGNVPDLSADGVNVVDDKADEELDTSADDELMESDARTLSDLVQSSDGVDVERTDAAGDDISTEMLAMENIDYGNITPRNTDEKDKVDMVDSVPVVADITEDDTYKPEQPAVDTVLSVREMANQLNKAESPGTVTPRMPTTPRTSTRTKRERESRRDDDGGYEFSLSEPEREWTIKSAYSDYQAMAKLLSPNPSLAGRHDFLSGYTALHWAAKNGQEDVVKLLFGSKEPPSVDARSRGGYTPLHVATIHGQDGVVRLLIDVYGASQNIRDYSGRKPKHYFAYSAVSARVQQLPQPPPPGSAQRASVSSNKHGRLVYPGGQPEATSPSPGSSPGPSSRKGSAHSDSGLMPPPRELPAVVRRRPVVSSSSVDSTVGADKSCHSDSEMHHSGSDTELHVSGSTPNFSAFV